MNSKRFTMVRIAGSWAMALGMVAMMLFSAVSPAYAANVHVSSVSVGGPSGTATYGTAADVNYTVTVACAGSGGGIMVTPSISSVLPSGVSGFFTPSTLSWGQNCGSASNPQTTTLTLHTTASTPGGVSSFTVDITGVSGSGSLTVHGKPLTVTGFAALNKQYNGNTIAAPDLSGIGLSSGVIFPDQVFLDTSAVSASFSDKFVGNGKLVTGHNFGLTGAQASNYSLTDPTTIANITKADLHIFIDTVQDKVYDGNTDAVVTFTTDKVFGDSVTVSGTGSFDTRNAGTHKLVTVPTVSLGGADAGNYNVVTTTASAFANISARALTVTAVADAKPYDGSVSSSASPSITSGALQGLDTAGFSQSFDSKDVGSGKVLTPAGAVSDGNGGNNYAVIFVPVSTGVVNPRPITTVTADNKSIGFGDPDPAFTFSYAVGDLALGDTPADINIAPACGVSGDHSAAGSYPIVCSGGSDPNYDFSATNYVNGTLTRSAAPISFISDTFSSNGSYDGWILESGELTNVGGTKNAGGATLRVGDDALNKQYKSILSFDTSSLPDSNMTITQVTVKVKLQKIVGGNKIFTSLKGLLIDVDRPLFGKKLNLELNDFKVKPPVAAGLNAAGTFGSTPDGSGWYSVNLNPSAFQFINLGGTTQFRLRFTKDDNNNLLANYLSLFSGNSANAPQLVISYSVP